MNFNKFATDLGICHSRLTKALNDYDHFIKYIDSGSDEVGPEKMSTGERLLQEFIEIDKEIGKLGWDLQEKMENDTGKVLEMLSSNDLAN